ncbi:hypothetical protein [Orrella sp. 11846]|uniref:hypothetical protein n=1 Tax=Orrella sp. 11846 TaxID=3409913 RepID=UPI003B5A531A
MSSGVAFMGLKSLQKAPLRHTLVRQQGQALAEAVVMLAVAGAFLVGITTTARLQLQWHEDLLHSHLVAKAVSLGHKPKSMGAQDWLGLGRKLQLPKLGSIQNGLAKGRSLLSEWTSGAQRLGADRLVSSVQKRFMPAHQNNRRSRARPVHWNEFSEVVEQPVVALAGGQMSTDPLLDGPVKWIHVQSDSTFANQAWHVRGTGEVAQSVETIDRIDQAHTLWQSAATPSRALTNSIKAQLTSMDAFWGRVSPPSDWLSKWHDINDEEPGFLLNTFRKTTNFIREIF